MKSEAREKKKAAIFEAAYSILQEKGYKGTSMLAVAKAAKASNETMYNWFGDKQGLLVAMIEANADKVSAPLIEALAKGPVTSPNEFTERLEIFGGTLLQLLTSETTVALNRAAAADVAAGNVLGGLLAEHGRNKIVGLLETFFTDSQKADILVETDTREIVEVYIALLLGDIQIRRVIGVMNKPAHENTLIHSQRVNELILQLFGKEK